MKYLATFVVLFVSLISSAQIRLLKDINTKVGGGEYAFFPHDLYTFGTNAYFLQRTTASDTYLYRTNGTSVDAVPPVQDTHNLKSLNGKLYFSSFRHVMGYANVWKFDPLVDTEGSIAVTLPVHHIDTIVVHSNHLYVVGSSDFPASQQIEIWKTDGTQGGSVKLVTLNSIQYKSLKNLTAVDDKLYFTFDGYKDTYSETGNEIWVSDGTQAGTNVIDAIPGAGGADYANLLDGGDGLLYFTFSNNRALMRTDGSAAGTVELYFDSNLKPGNVTRVGNKTFFSTFSALWTTDGTKAGTVKVKDMPVSQPEGIRSLISFRDSLFFIGPDGNGRTALWKSNGTTAGTAMNATVGIFPNQSLTTANDSLYFFGYGNNGDNLYKTNGRSFGSTTIMTGFGNYGGGGFIHVLGTRVYFSYKINGVFDLWVSDGKPANTHIVPKVNVSPEGSGGGENTGAVLNNKFIFYAYDGTTTGTTPLLWISDGTTAGTQPLKDLNPNEPGAGPSKFFTFGDHVYFVANTAPANGGFPRDAIWKTDGTTTGTVHVKDQVVVKYFAINDELHFFSYIPGRGTTTIWKTDGTSSGTVEVVPELSVIYDPASSIEVVNNVAYFSTGDVLWRTDGTPSGTYAVSDAADVLRRMVRAGDKLFFTTSKSPVDKLWVIRNNNPMPELVKDFPYNTTDYLDIAGDRVILTLSQGGFWSSDGTAAGTIPVGNGYHILVNNSNTIAYHPSLGSSLFMSYNNPPTREGYELWKTDGTQAGTVIVKDIEFPNLADGPDVAFNGSYPQQIFTYKNKVYFFTHWGEFWESGGTEATTKRLDPGKGLQVKGIYPVGDRIIFVAKDFRVGTELFVIDLNSTKEDQTISFTTSPSRTFGEGNFNLTATATSGLPVIFTSSDPSVLKIEGNSVEILKAGNAQIIATQLGNENFNAAPQVIVDVMVNKSAQTITFTGPTSKTIGDANFNLTASSTSGLAVSFSTTSTNINLAANVISLLSAGKANVVASQEGNGNYLAAENKEIEFCINPLPPVIALAGTNVTSTASAGNSWYKDNVLLAETGQQIPADDGNYSATVTVDGCVSIPSLPLTVTTIINGLEDPLGLAISPNPATDHVYIHWSGPDNANIELINSIGLSTNVVATKISQGLFELNVGDLSPGFYVLSITSDSVVSTARLVIH